MPPHPPNAAGAPPHPPLPPLPPPPLSAVNRSSDFQPVPQQGFPQLVGTPAEQGFRHRPEMLVPVRVAPAQQQPHSALRASRVQARTSKGDDNSAGGSSSLPVSKWRPPAVI